MSWIKVDDGFPDHPKFLEAGPLGGYLCLCAIAWSNRNRTDGFVPRGQVRRLVDFEGFAHHMWAGELVGGGDDVDAMQLAEELVTVGLWERVKGGFLIHDYLDWQRSREEIEALTEQRREAGKKGGQARSASTSLSVSSSKSSGNSSSKPLSASPSKTQAEVRSKKEEETPPKPPASGGRKRAVDSFERTAVAWADSAGVTGDRARIVRAYGQAAPWLNDQPAEHFRGFCRHHFPSLTVKEESMADIHPLPERAA